MTTCLNCEQPVDGKFCSHCGQKASTRRFTVHNVLHDLPHALFHVDKGILKNIMSILHPRRSVQEYLAGKRVGYFNPLIFVLLGLGLILYLEHLLHRDISFDFDVTLDIGGPLNIHATEFFNHYFKYFYFCCAFIFALPNTLIYRRSTGYNYAEHVMIQAFIMGYVNIIYLLLIPFPLNYQFPTNFTVWLLYLAFTMLVLHKKNVFFTILRALLAMVLQILFLPVFAFITGVVYSLLHDLF